MHSFLIDTQYMASIMARSISIMYFKFFEYLLSVYVYVENREKREPRHRNGTLKQTTRSDTRTRTRKFIGESSANAGK